MDRLMTDSDFDFLRKNHFLSKNLTEYLHSVHKQVESPFEYDQAAGIRHRLKRKLKAAKIFLEICNELHIESEYDKQHKYIVMGDEKSIEELLNVIKYQKEIHSADSVGVHFRTKEFYYRQEFHKLIFWVIANDPKYRPFLKLYVKDSERIFFVLGPNYQKDQLEADLGGIPGIRDIPKILLVNNVLPDSLSDLIEKYQLIPLVFNKQILKSEKNLKTLFF